MKDLNHTGLPSLRPSSSETAHDNNRGIVLEVIRMHEGISRADLARATGLQKSTVSVIVEHLLGIGWVRESAVQAIKYGRHPKMLTINDRLAALAVDLRPSRAVLSVVDFRGRIMDKSAILLASQPKEALEDLREAIKHLMKAHPEVGFQGIGVSVPGRVDRQSGNLVFAPNLQWGDVDLTRQLSERVGLPVEVGNAADAVALAEQWFANFRGVRDAVVVTVSEGVGTGVLSGGRLLEGWHGMAGEFGHVVMDESGPACGCGKHGCWEVFASNRAAERYYAGGATSKGKLRTYTEILAGAHDKDPRAIAAIKEQFLQVGRGLRFVLPFAPEIILIVGEMVSLWKQYGPIIDREIKAHTINGYAPQLMVASDGEMARLRGASALILQRVYNQGTRVLSPMP